MGFILGYGVFIMILAYFDTVPQYLFVVLEQSIAILNRIIAWIASFESFVIKDLLLNQAMLISLYIMLIMVFIYLKKPRFKKLFFAMLSILIFQSTLYISKYYYQQQKEFIVFNAHKNSLISMRFGQKIVVCNKSRGIDKQYADQLIKQYCGANFIKTIARKQISNLYYFNNKKILVIDSIAIYPDKINPDIIVLSHSPRLNLERFLQNNKPELIIADASNFKSYVSLWANSCQQRHLNFHSTADKGYFAIAGTINER